MHTISRFSHFVWNTLPFPPLYSNVEGVPADISRNVAVISSTPNVHGHCPSSCVYSTLRWVAIFSSYRQSAGLDCFPWMAVDWIWVTVKNLVRCHNIPRSSIFHLRCEHHTLVAGLIQEMPSQFQRCASFYSEDVVFEDPTQAPAYVLCEQYQYSCHENHLHGGLDWWKRPFANFDST